MCQRTNLTPKFRKKYIPIVIKKSINKHKYLQLLQRFEYSHHDSKIKCVFTRKYILKRPT